MKIITHSTFVFLLAFSLLLPAESKRIEVYPLSQNYWDTKPGETLGEIAHNLLPNNPRMQAQLINDVINMNPDAFVNNNPDRMKANTRLWLPNRLTQADNKVDVSKYSVQTFSWGNIKRLKR